MKRNRGMGGHQSAKMKSDTWLTPPSLIKSLGDFDLDPCSPLNRPWDTATHHYTIKENGLLQKWFGRVWLNPPYGRFMRQWLVKMSSHLNGIALIFARTDTKDFQDYVFPFVESMLFIRGRITFLDPFGNTPKYNGGAPSVLLSYSEFDSDAISASGIEGRHVLINSLPVITITQSPDWRSVVSIALINLNKQGSLSEIYAMVERIAPDKVARNKHYKEKIRQKLQRFFPRVAKGVYTHQHKLF